MNKQEYFIIMGSIIGVLFLIVVALSIVLKMSFGPLETNERVVDNNVVVNNTTKNKETKKEEKVSYTEVNFEKEEKSIDSDFTINITDDAGQLTNELFYQTSFYNYYAKDFSSTFTFIQKGDSSYPLKASLSDKMISIYDVKNKLNGSIKEELRYDINFGNTLNTSFDFNNNTLYYKNGKEIVVTKDNNNRYTLLELAKNEMTHSELLNLFKIYNSEGKNTAYTLDNDSSSYMFEQNNTRIFICSNNDIYVGSTNFDSTCE